MNNIPAYLVEFIGTFIFMYVIITTGEAIPIGLTLAAMVYFGGKISGGAFNPAVAVMLFLKKSINHVSLIIYLIVQFLAAFLAYKASTIKL
jgi:aquaporin Z